MGDHQLSTRQLLVKIPNFPCLYRHSVTGKYYGIKKIRGVRREHSLDKYAISKICFHCTRVRRLFGIQDAAKGPNTVKVTFSFSEIIAISEPLTIKICLKSLLLSNFQFHPHNSLKIRGLQKT
jgi:hypothetical protein